jgi:hypothetical protein
MLKSSSNGIQATATAAKFQIQSMAETISELQKPIDPRHFRTRKQGTTTVTYVPWVVVGNSECANGR